MNGDPGAMNYDEIANREAVRQRPKQHADQLAKLCAAQTELLQDAIQATLREVAPFLTDTVHQEVAVQVTHTVNHHLAWLFGRGG